MTPTPVTPPIPHYPVGAPLQDQLRFLLRYAILAPSSHNTQPWLFEIHPDRVDVLADPRRVLKVIDPAGRQLAMSCGAALYNLRVALRRVGYECNVAVLPDPSDGVLLASVRVHGRRRPSGVDVEVFDAIPRRRTNRQPFDGRPVAYWIFDELAAFAESEGASLARVHPRARARLADVIAAADRTQFADRGFRQELARWLVPYGSRRADGIPFWKKEYGSVLPLGVALLVRTFDIGGEVAARETALVRGAPALVVLGTRGDQPADWIAAGQAMQAVLLRACCHGLSASFLNQALELDERRAEVAALLDPGRRGGGGHGAYPQLIMRLGFGPPVLTATPRRRLEEVAADAGERTLQIELPRRGARAGRPTRASRRAPPR